MAGQEEKSRCRDCGKVWVDDALDLIEDISLRVEAGEPMPSGQCPDCGALCQPGDDRPLCPFCRNGAIDGDRYEAIVGQLGRDTIEAVLESIDHYEEESDE